jgi:hypothetical protein
LLHSIILKVFSWAEGVVKTVEILPSKHEALNSNPTTTTTRKKKKSIFLVKKSALYL